MDCCRKRDSVLGSVDYWIADFYAFMANAVLSTGINLDLNYSRVIVNFQM